MSGGEEGPPFETDVWSQDTCFGVQFELDQLTVARALAEHHMTCMRAIGQSVRYTGFDDMPKLMVHQFEDQATAALNALEPKLYAYYIPGAVRAGRNTKIADHDFGPWRSGDETAPSLEPGDRFQLRDKDDDTWTSGPIYIFKSYVPGSFFDGKDWRWSSNRVRSATKCSTCDGTGRVRAPYFYCTECVGTGIA